jgi:uncharacterized membrane protein YjjP (DUF1212 family)
MRDFANDQARAAIHTYRRQTSQRNANTKWLLAACALVSASSVWWFSGGDDATMRMAAAAGVVITIFWTWQAVLLTRRVLKLKTSQVSSDPAPSSRDR